MATPAEKAMRMIFPEASNQPQQTQRPWWMQGNSLSGRGATPVGRGRERRRNVFYDAQTGAPTSNAGSPIGGAANDLELIREIMKPRSSIVVNDPSGWLDGRASQDFQKFFSRTPEQEANYARRKRELDAGSVANINPEITRNAVDVARKNQEAMDMIFPKAPQGSGQPVSTDIAKQNMPGGGFTAQLDGRYGTGSSTVMPQMQGPPKSAMSQAAPATTDQQVAELFGPPSSLRDPFDLFGTPAGPTEQMGPPTPPMGPPNYGEVTGPFPEQSGPPNWMNSSAWQYTPIPQNEADTIRTIAGRGDDTASRFMQVLNPFMTFSTLRQGGKSALPESFGPQPTYANPYERLAGDAAVIKNLRDRGLLKTNRTTDKFGEKQIQVMRPIFNGFPIPF